MDFNLKKAGRGGGRGRKVCTHKLKVAPPRVYDFVAYSILGGCLQLLF